MDIGVVNKIKAVYPNVVFGPLSRALQLDAMSEVDYVDINGLVQTSDYNDWEVNPNESNNPIATGDTAVSDYGSDRTSKNRAVAFPLIAIDRINNGLALQDAANDPYIRKGWQRGRDLTTMRGDRERAFPVEPIYQIDIISNRRYEVDELWRELSMYLYLDANVSVIYSSGTENEFVEEYPLIMLDTDTTTDIESFEDKGIIYRQTITTILKDARLLFQKEAPLIQRVPIHFIKPGEEFDHGTTETPSTNEVWETPSKEE